MGRIMIPVKLREQMNLEVGREYTFSTMEKDGRRYICIDCGRAINPVDEAIKLLEENGLKVSQD